MGNGAVLPQDSIKYTATVQVSDFSSLKDLVIKQDIDNGQTVDPTVAPVFTYTENGTQYTVTLPTIPTEQTTTTPGENSDVIYTAGYSGSDSSSNVGWSFTRDATTGHTLVTFYIGAALQAQYGSSVLASGTTGSLTFQTKALTAYSPNTSGKSSAVITENDTLTATDTASATLVSMNTEDVAGDAVITADGGNTGLTVPKGEAGIRIVAVNGVAITDDKYVIRPGDKVTYATTYTLKSGDYNDLTLKSYLPQGTFSTSDPTGNGTTQFTQASTGGGDTSVYPESGQYQLVSSPNDVKINKIVENETSNSLEFTLTQKTAPDAKIDPVEIYFTVTASNAPMADGLPLTTLVEGSLTNGSGNTVQSQQIAGTSLVEPDLDTTTGIVSIVDDSGASKSLTYTDEVTGKTYDPSQSFNIAGSSGVPTKAGQLTDGILSQVDNLNMTAAGTSQNTQVDGGDTVRLATTVVNNGKSAAYDVSLSGKLPDSIGLSQIENFQIYSRDASGNLVAVENAGGSTVAAQYFSTTGSGFTIPVTGNAPALYGTGDTDHVGQNVLVVVYDVKLAPDTVVGGSLVWDGTIKSFANKVGGSNFVQADGTDVAGGTLSDDATIALAKPTITIGTDSSDSPQNDGTVNGTTGLQVVVGETRPITMTVSVPEGTLEGADKGNITLTTPLPAGMVIKPNSQITIASLDGKVTTYNVSDIVSSDGKTLTFPLGNSISNSSVDKNADVIVKFDATFPDTIDGVSQTVADGTHYSTAATLQYSGAPVSTSGITFDQINPSVSGVLTSTVEGGGSTDAVYSGDTLDYTYTITNNGKAVAEDIQQILQLNNLTLVAGSASVTSGNLTISETANNTVSINGQDLRLKPGESATFTFKATVNPNQAAASSDTVTTTSGTYKTMATDSLDTTTHGNSNTGHTFTFDTKATATVADYSNVQLKIVGESNAGLASETNQQVSVSTPIGDIVRFKGSVDVPTGENHVVFDVAIPSGMSVDLSNNNITIALLSSSGNVVFVDNKDFDASSTALQVKETGAKTDPSTVEPTYKIPASAVSIVDGHLKIDLGTIQNNDTARDSSNNIIPTQVVFEFNAITNNTSANKVGSVQTEKFTVSDGTAAEAAKLGRTSNSVRQTIIEPHVTMTKVQTGFDQNTGIATYQVTLNNTGNTAAYRINVTDPLGDNTTYVPTSLSFKDGTTPGAFDTSGLNFTLNELDAKTGTFTYTYQVKVNDVTAPSADKDSTITYEGLTTSTQSLNGTTGGAKGTDTGGRDGSNPASVDNYYAKQTVGLSVVTGTLYSALGNLDATPTFNNSLDTPLGGVTLTATSADGKITETTTTRSDGTFSFYGLPDGKITITAAQPGTGGLDGKESNVYITNGTKSDLNAASSSVVAQGDATTGFQIVYRTPDTKPTIDGVDSSTVTTQKAGTANSLLHGENPSPVVHDTELDKLYAYDSSLYNYGGTVLTVQRYDDNGTATPTASDSFAGKGTAKTGVWLDKNVVYLDMKQVGTYTLESGKLAITFQNGADAATNAADRISATTVQTVLAGLTYTNTNISLDQKATKIGITLDDHNLSDNQGTGGDQTSSVYYSIFDTTASYPFSQTYVEPNGEASAQNALSLTLPQLAGDTQVQQYTLSFSDGYQKAEDVLNYTPNSGTGDIVSQTTTDGSLVLVSTSGKATQDQWNAALKAISYYNTSDTPTLLQRTLTRTVDLTNGNKLVQFNAVIITVHKTDDSPVLNTNVNVTLPSVQEDQQVGEQAPVPVGAVGTPVTDLIHYKTDSDPNSGTVSDTDANNLADGQTNGASPGMVVTHVDTTYGKWFYTTDKGNTWKKIDNVSASHALYLVADANTRISFVPDQLHYNGTIPNALTYRAWDQADPHDNGTYAALPAANTLGTGTGAGASYSSAEKTLSQTVIALNNAPLASGTAVYQSGVEDAAPTTLQKVSDLFGKNFDDSADQQYNSSTNPDGSHPDTLAGVALTSNPTPITEGKWYYTTDGNQLHGVPVPSDLSETNALVLGGGVQLYFVPSKDFNGIPQPLQGHLIDSSTQIPVYATTTGADLAGSTTVQTGVDVSGVHQGGDTAVSTNTVALDAIVQPVNDAPVASGAASLPSVAEDHTALSSSDGQTVGQLFGNNFKDTADQQKTTDNTTGSTENTLAGVAIVGNNTPESDGKWVYSTDGGKTWQDVGSVAQNKALVLGQDVKLAFSPAANFNGTPSPLTARLIDTSTDVPVNGTTTGADIAQPGTVIKNVDTTNNDGKTAISAQTVDLSTSVSSVNDAPVATGTAALPDGKEDAGPVSGTISTMFAGNFNDSIDQQQTTGNSTGSIENTLAGVAITGNDTPVNEGKWQYSTDGGTVWQDVGTVAPNSALILGANAQLQFVPAANFNGIPKALEAHLIDTSTDVPVYGTTTGADIAQAGFVSQASIDVTNNGGITAISKNQVDVLVNIKPVNDAPVASGAATALPETEDKQASGQSVTDLFGGNFNDTVDQQQTAANSAGSTENTLAGIAITGNDTPVSEGAWKYSTDGGKTWQEVGPVASDSALVLNKNAQLRFDAAPDFNGDPKPLTVHLIDSSTDVPVYGTTTGADIAKPDFVSQASVDTQTKGGITALSNNSVDLNVHVAAVNDAPKASGTAVLPPSTVEGVPNSQSVSDLFGSTFNDTTDEQKTTENPSGSSQNAFAGVAVTANNSPSSEGTWRYSTDNGKTWQDVGSVAPNSALVLSQDALLQFDAASGFSGTPQPLTAHLIDGSTDVPVYGTTTGALIEAGGVAMHGVDVRGNGGNTAISADGVDLTTTVHVAPVANGSATLIAGVEDGTPPTKTVTDLFGDNFQGVTNSFAGVAITVNTTPASEGAWRYSTDNGKTWQDVGQVSTGSALLLSGDAQLEFSPAPNFNGAPQPLTAHLVDNSSFTVNPGVTGADVAKGGLALKGVDVSDNGGTTPLSAGTVDLNTTEQPVPDAPTAQGTAILPAIAQDGTPVGETVKTLFEPHYDNALDQQQTDINPTGSQAAPIAGVAITANPTPATEGTWVYSTDNGQHWIQVPKDVDTSHALVLPNDTLIAFVPAHDFNGAPLPLAGRPIAAGPGLLIPGMPGAELHSVMSNVDISKADQYGAVALTDVPVITSVTPLLLRPEVTPGANTIGVPQEGSNISDLFDNRYDDHRREQYSPINPTGTKSEAFGGIAITSNPTTPAEGVWRYTVDGGKSWTNIPNNLSNDHAFVVPANAHISFKGAGGYTGSTTLTVHLLRQIPDMGTFVDIGTGPYGNSSLAAVQLEGRTISLPRQTTTTLRNTFSADALTQPVVEAWLGDYHIPADRSEENGWLRGYDTNAFVMINTQDAVSVSGQFKSSDPASLLNLSATQRDGAPLPDWVTFDPLTGTFTVVAPSEAPDSIDLKVVAHDGAMRTADSLVHVVIGRDPMQDLLGTLPSLPDLAHQPLPSKHGHKPFHHQVRHAVHHA